MSVDCGHPNEPHTLWAMTDDGGPPVPTSMKFDNRADAVAKAEAVVKAHAPSGYEHLFWIKIFRSGNEAYTCWRWEPPEEPEPVRPDPGEKEEGFAVGPPMIEANVALLLVLFASVLAFFVGYGVG